MYHTQGGKFIGIFYNIFRGNSIESSHLPRFNFILMHLWFLSTIFFGRRNNFVCFAVIPEIFVQTQGSDYWLVIHLDLI